MKLRLIAARIIDKLTKSDEAFVVITISTITIIIIIISFIPICRYRPIYDDRDPIGYELISNKPSKEYYLKKKSIVYQNNEKIGKILHPIHVGFFSNSHQDSILIIYAWIWSKSVEVDADSTVTLITSENLRIASNRRIFAKFVSGSKGKFIYENSRRSWMFVQFNVSTDRNNSSNKRSSLFSGIPDMTITHSAGGDFPDDRGMRIGPW